MHSDELRPESVDASFVPRLRDSVAAAELDGEAVLFNEGTGRLHALNTIATFVWSCVDGIASVQAIAEELADAFHADYAVVENDVLGLVRRLGAEGMLMGVAADEAVVAEEAAMGESVAYEHDSEGCA